MPEHLYTEAVISPRPRVAVESVSRPNPAELWRLLESLNSELRHHDRKATPILLAAMGEIALLVLAVNHGERLLRDANWGFLISMCSIGAGSCLLMGFVSGLRILNPTLAAQDRRRGRSGEVPIGALSTSYVFSEDLRRVMGMARPPTPENKEAEYRRLLDELRYRSSQAGEERVCDDLAERIVEVSIQSSQKAASVRHATFWLYWGLILTGFLVLTTILVLGTVPHPAS